MSSLDRQLIAIIGLSLGVSLSATTIGVAIGAPLGGLLGMTRMPGRQGLIVIVHGLLGLPPVVVGLALYLLLSHSGLLGFTGLLFTPGAMILAQVVLTTPIATALAHSAMEPLWNEYGNALRSLGASKLECLWQLLMMAAGPLVTAFLAAFGRAIAEVGAIMIVGGNIRGHTRTMTTAIALDTSTGDLSLALALGLVLIALSLAVSTTAFGLQRAMR